MEMNSFYWILGIGITFIAGRAILKKISEPNVTPKDPDSRIPNKKNPALLMGGSTTQTEVEKRIEESTKINTLVGNCSSKQAFINNLNMFLPLLPKLQHGIMDSKEWNSVILSINNPNLTSDWEKRCNLPIQRWIDKLASWGVSCEKCTAFKGNSYYEDKYDITTDSKMVDGKQYEVIDWYWVLTATNEAGGVEKRIILKGKAK